jgi:predicted TIM-barrel fold metal-dependent hydrolase
MEMKLIDLENHYYDSETVDAMAKRRGYPYFDREAKAINWSEGIQMPFGVLHDLLLDTDERIATMDKTGITTAVISPSQGLEELDPSESIDLTRKNNDKTYALTQKYRGRYLGSAALPVKDINASCKELRRCVNELGFVCWHTHSNYTDESIEQEKFIPIFETAAELGIYIYLHPTLPVSKDFAEYGFTFAGPAAGFTFDAYLAVMKLIVKGVFDRVPETKIVLGHLGEAIPFLLDRIDNRLNFLPNDRIKNQKRPSEYFKDNIKVTTSGNMSPAAFQCTKDVIGIENIIFGSDYPYENIDAMTDYVKNLDLTEKEKESLFFKNAERLLNNVRN